jgi:hypothetical protein
MRFHGYAAPKQTALSITKCIIFVEQMASFLAMTNGGGFEALHAY